MEFERLDLLFDKAESLLRGDAQPLSTLKAMHELMKEFHKYLEKKLDDDLTT